ncbi:ABC transporter substrate-binding protein [Crenobacter cavernae]|uniref:ABC transporter substrate-binding protein n=2 Tax=Crenobacter cavernae TaxID=2290923 RepID=A0A345Y6M0_9NEIS|nr:ABC transporter substrate-binding protein [Crenobacter cavernae]
MSWLTSAPPVLVWERHRSTTPTMFRRFLAGVLAALFALSTAHAAPSAPMRVGVEKLDYYPFYASDGKRYWGYARDLMDAYAAARGQRFHYEPLPVAELFRLFLGSDRLDFKFPDNPRWSEADKTGKTVRYSQPVGVLTEGLVVRRAGLGQPLSRLRTVGIVKGFMPSSIARALRRGEISLVESPSLDALFQQLAIGRLDAVYVELQVARQRLAFLKLDKQLAPDPTLPADRHELRLSSRLHPERIADFDRFLVDDAERVRELKRRYGLL